jgi:hypothetical protein
MTTYKKRPDFATSEEGIRVREELALMVLDDSYLTESSFSIDSAKYANNRIPFIDKHLAYLQNNPATNIDHYLANLRLKTKVRR